MLKNLLTPVVALLLVMVSASAHAVFGTPYVTPASPTAGQTISVNIYGGGCDGIAGVQGYPQITQQRNAVTILFNGVRYTNPELCTLTLGTATYPVAAYSAGSYTLTVQLRYPNAGGEFVIDTLGVIPFSVAGQIAQPVATPTMDERGLVVLALVLMGLAARMLQSKRAAAFHSPSGRRSTPPSGG